MSAARPVSDASTSAAAAEGATPKTGRPSARSCSTAGARAVVLPVPAGPTTRTRSASPATAAAVSACGPVRSTAAAFDRVGRVGSVSGHAALGPGEEPFFLGEDGRGGEGSVGDRLGDRPAVAAQHGAVGDGAGDVDAVLVDAQLGQPVQQFAHDRRVDVGVGGDGGGDLAGEFGGSPGRLLLRQGVDGLAHHVLRCGRVEVSGCDPAGGIFDEV